MKNNNENANWVVITEILFCILPVLVILVFEFTKCSFEGLFNKADMSFCTMILYGQCIVKLVIGLLKKKTNTNWQFVSLIITLLIVFGLIPATVIVIVLQSEEVFIGVKILQIILFIVSIYVYFQIAGLAEKYNQQEE